MSLMEMLFGPDRCGLCRATEGHYPTCTLAQPVGWWMDVDPKKIRREALEEAAKIYEESVLCDCAATYCDRCRAVARVRALREGT